MKHLIPVLAAYFLFITPLFAMTPEEAYQKIGHRQTTFNSDKSNLDTIETEYLDQLFYLIDRAIVQRIEAEIWIGTEEGYDSYMSQTNNIISQIKALNPPAKLNNVNQLIVDSLIEQTKYYEHLHSLRIKNDRVRVDTNHPALDKSHRGLINAYNQLMRMYPNESGYNKKAFYDHMCVMDII